MYSVLLLRNDGQEQNRVAFTPVTFGFQNSSNFNLGVQILSRKFIESTFVCIKPQVHIISESAAIIILLQRSFSSNDAATPYFSSFGRVSC
jgi:hypothetical protein